MVLIVAAVAFGPSGAFGADPLEAWIATALDRNPELIAAKKKWLAAKQKAPQASALDDPMIGADIERSDTTRFDTYSDVEWMVSQKIPWPAKLRARKSVASLEAEVVGFKYLELMREVRARVIRAYWDLWLAQKSVEVVTENKSLMEQFERIARSRYETGQVMQPDLLRAQVELAKMSNELITMEREVPVAQSAVNALLNASSETPRKADQPIFIPPLSLTLEQMQEQARQYCCILMSFLRAVEARASGVRVARLESAPDIELRVEARQFNGRSGIQEYDTGVFINFPWLWRGKYRAMVNEAKAEKDMAEAELQDEINQTMLEVKELYTAADTSLRLMKLYEDTVLPRARQLVESTRAGYEAGNATFLELVEAQREWRNAQLDHYRAMAAHGRTRSKLDQVIAPWGEREFASGLVTPDMK
jgi:cobalt-zinc-cadmium efflux system outer membrane protein